MQTASLDGHAKGTELPLLCLGDLSERYRIVRSAGSKLQVVEFDVTKPAWYRADAGSPDQPLEPGKPLRVVLEPGVCELSLWFGSRLPGVRLIPRMVS